MTIANAKIDVSSETVEGGAHPAAATVSLDSSTYTPCTGYREACNLAGRLRYEGRDAFAVFNVAMNCWCVR